MSLRTNELATEQCNVHFSSVCTESRQGLEAPVNRGTLSLKHFRIERGRVIHEKSLVCAHKTLHRKSNGIMFKKGSRWVRDFCSVKQTSVSQPKNMQLVVQPALVLRSHLFGFLFFKRFSFVSLSPVHAHPVPLVIIIALATVVPAAALLPAHARR